MFALLPTAQFLIECSGLCFIHPSVSNKYDSTNCSEYTYRALTSQISHYFVHHIHITGWKGHYRKYFRAAINEIGFNWCWVDIVLSVP